MYSACDMFALKMGIKTRLGYKVEERVDEGTKKASSRKM
jgi:hypothetical protein